ncbi:MAG: hypothetical protein ABIR56_14930 [Polaromonas sp.]
MRFKNLPVQQRAFSDWEMDSAVMTPSELLTLSTRTVEPIEQPTDFLAVQATGLGNALDFLEHAVESL